MNYGIFQNLLRDKLNCIKERLIYMSPEYRYLIFITKYFDYEKSDIFSIGLLIINLE